MTWTEWTDLNYVIILIEPDKALYYKKALLMSYITLHLEMGEMEIYPANGMSNMVRIGEIYQLHRFFLEVHWSFADTIR